MKIRCALFAAIVLVCGNLPAQITLPSFFGDQMVLQRDAPVPIWGKAGEGETVTVEFAGQTVATKANQKGKWRLTLQPLTASKKPQQLILTGNASDARTIVKDVLVGEVWVGSGQSNMAGRVAGYAKNDETLAALLQKSPHPMIRLMQGGPKPIWVPANANNVGQFSALHFAFGERLQRELDVPVGLIVGAVGGTPSGFWIPPQAYADSAKCKAVVAVFAKTYDHERAMRQYEKRVADWEQRAAAAKAKGEKRRGRKPRPPVEPGRSSRGGKIGGLYARFIEPVAGYRIRGVLWDQGEARSGVVGVDQHTMMSELIRGWRSAWQQGDFPFLFVQKPSGGGCAFSKGDAITRNADPFQGKLPPIDKLGSGDQRFLYVRLMNDNAQAWMVPASDLGSGIHPTNKWGYGNRAAQVALSQVYKTGIQAYGPRYQSHATSGGKVTITFADIGRGLTVAHGDTLQGFALAGDDGNWHWAEATIEGDKVVVGSKRVPKPTRVRYAFAARRQWANLFNKDGLPALAFEAGE